jgi:hypothetical protein
MNATLTDYFEELELANVKRPASQPKSQTLSHKTGPEKTDMAFAIAAPPPISLMPSCIAGEPHDDEVGASCRLQ